MVTLAQRITELRTERNMSRPELSVAMGLPKNAAENCAVGVVFYKRNGVCADTAASAADKCIGFH